MKAIVTRKFGIAPEMAVEDRPCPTPAEGFTLVRMHSASLNQLSNTIRSGGHPLAKAPVILGNEGAGIVEQSDRFEVGQLVAIYGGGQLGITADGLFQQWALVEDRSIIPLPTGLSLEEGAVLTVNYLTAYRALTKAARLQTGEKVVISGATGGVGHALIQVAKALGGEPIALVSTPEKARRAEKAGALAAIDLSSKDPVDAVLHLTGGKGADLGFDPVGGKMLDQLLRSIRRRGSVVLLGFTGGKQPCIDAFDMIAGEKRVGGYSLHSETDEDVAQSLGELMLVVGERGLKPVIDTIVDLNDFEQGYRRLASRETIGSVVIRL